MEIRLLAAPKLEKQNLGPRVLGHRPCRHGPPRMCVEHIGNKIVAHNYGHAGSGWTMAPGAVKYVNDLLIGEIGKMATESGQSTQSDLKKMPIHVIGAGIIGLFTAYDLLKRGFHNLTLVAAHFEELTSHNAGGLLAPTSLEIPDAEAQALIDRICFDAYHYYAEIVHGEHPDLPLEGAKILPVYFDLDNACLDPYVQAGVMKPAKEVLVQFDASHGKQRRMKVFDDAIFIEPYAMMHALRQHLLANGVQFIQQKVNSLEDLQCPVIVNCTGIGARELCGDKLLHSVQGHLILLRDQNPSDLNYMLVHWIESGVTESGQSLTRAFYVFPKRSSGAHGDVGVIGGTFVEDADESTPNTEEFEKVLKNAVAFLNGEDI